MTVSSVPFVATLIAGCTHQVERLSLDKSEAAVAPAPESVAADADFKSESEVKAVATTATLDLGSSEVESSNTDLIDISLIDSTLTDRDFEACLFVLEWTLPSEHEDEGLFVAIGSRPGTSFADPPAAAITRLQQKGFTVLPASVARWPEPGEKDNSGRFRGIENPQTGARSKIYHVDVKRWIDRNTAEVAYQSYSGPLGADGGTVIIQQTDSLWSITSRGDSWFD